MNPVHMSMEINLVIVKFQKTYRFLIQFLCRLTLEEALKAVQVWLASATNGIDNETQKIIEKVRSHLITSCIFTVFFQYVVPVLLMNFTNILAKQLQV